jgi:hypothetical protein
MWCRDDLFYTANEIEHRFIQDEFGGTKGTLNEDIRDPKIGYTKAFNKLANSDDYKRFVLEMKETFENVPLIGPKAIEEFNEHLRRYPGQHSVHHKHLIETMYYMAVHKPEKELFEGLVELVAARGESTPEVVSKLTAARASYEPAKEALKAWIKAIDPDDNMDQNDRLEYSVFEIVMDMRRAGIEQLLNDIKIKDEQARTQAINFSFLVGDVVEK